MNILCKEPAFIKRCLIASEGLRDLFSIGVLSALVAAAGCAPGEFAEAREVTAAKEAVRSRLNDPDSAQFRNVQTHAAAVCGEVNAKNRMGGYGGFERFIYVVSTRQIEIDTKNAPDAGGPLIASDQAEQQIRFNRLYIEHCIPVGQ